jgi:hypothetical protein
MIEERDANLTADAPGRFRGRRAPTALTAGGTESSEVVARLSGTESSNPLPSTGESHKPASRRIRFARPAVTSFSVLDAFRGATTLITSRTWTISLICSGWLRRRQRRPAALPAPAPEADQRRALSERQIREQRLAH